VEKAVRPGEDAGVGVKVDGGVGQAVQQELLVDDSLPWSGIRQLFSSAEDDMMCT
jgi:hypothetical protein